MKTIRNSPSGRSSLLPPPTQITWAPDGDAKTWGEVMDIVQDSASPIVVWLEPDSVNIVPAGTYDVRGMIIESPRLVNNRPTFGLGEGALVRNLGALNGAVQCLGASSSPCLAFDGDFGFLRVTDIASVQNEGSAPMIVVTPGNTIAIHLHLLAELRGNVVNATGGIVGVIVTDGAEIDDGFATGVPGATIGYIHDGSISFPTTTGFGSVVNLPFGQDGGYGPTGFRPQGLFQPVKTGCAYFDTTLNKMIWFNGTIWIDAAGAPA